jgi:hypothetical protein
VHTIFGVFNPWFSLPPLFLDFVDGIDWRMDWKDLVPTPLLQKHEARDLAPSWMHAVIFKNQWLGRPSIELRVSTISHAKSLNGLFLFIWNQN